MINLAIISLALGVVILALGYYLLAKDIQKNKEEIFNLQLKVNNVLVDAYLKEK